MKATILSWTLVHRAPAGTPTPFVLALVKTEQGTAFATGPAEAALTVGAEVALERDPNGAWRIGPA